MSTISKDTPLSEITFRRYEKPNAKARELVRKFCLSIGLLQPGDSRDIIVDILQVLIQSSKQKQMLSAEVQRSAPVLLSFPYLEDVPIFFQS